MLDPFVDGRARRRVGGGQAIGFAPDEQASLPPDIALAYASILKGAAEAELRSALDRLGRRLWRQQHDERRSGCRLEQRHRADLRLCRRHGLSRLAQHGLRLRARRRRHQLGARQRARQRPQRRLPGRRLRHHAIGSRLSRRRARLHQSLVHDQPLGARRSAHRELRRAKLRRAAGGRLPLSPCCRRLGVTPYGAVASAGLPYAELQRDRCDRRRLRAFLRAP